MSKKVLIVEDNEQNRILMRMILRHLQCELLEAVNGEEGIRLAKEQKPDLIYMDIQMPLMDGLTATKILKGDPKTKDIKIIIVTSYAMKGDRERALEVGADGYITKPINISEIEEITKRFLGL
jgi:CheY-like chemotaxis protein